MIFRSYYLGCLSHASYLLGDKATGTAIVVDPQRDIDQYLADAKAEGLTIKHVVLTHFHADFVAGHLELRDATGASIHMGHRADAEYAIDPLHEGDAWDFPSMRIRFIETPGHTPEMVNLIIYDKDADDETPWAVLTGDTLFNGDVGRPDLLASVGVSQDELADMLYDSVQKLMRLPDETKVYPAHGAGSMCGKALGDELVTTIGQQRTSNYALKATDRDEFVRLVTADQATPPAYFAHDAQHNRKERQVLTQVLQRLQAVGVEEAIAAANRGAQLLDTRNDQTFEKGHLEGSINVGIEGTYATWSGAVLDPERPVILITPPGKEEESAMRLGRIGYENVQGYIEGGFEAIETARPDLVRQAPRVDALEFKRMLQGDRPPVVVDVRSPGEREAGSIPDSVHLPLPELPSRLHEVPRDQDVVVHCAGGYRSSLAASLLRRAGHQRVSDLRGGIDAYDDAPEPVDGVEDVDVQTAHQMVQDGAYLLDVREYAEWAASRIPGADLRPLSTIREWIDEVPRDRPIVMQCRTGNRSRHAAQAVLDAGPAHVVNMDGGIMAWRQAGLPVEDA